MLSNYLNHYSGLTKSCWFGIMVNFIESILIGVYYFLSLYFVNELHFNLDVSGIILSTYGIGAVLGGIFGGHLTDRFLPQTVMALCLLIQAATYLFLIKLASPIFLMLDIGMLGFATYAFLTANHVWVLNQCQNDETQRLKAINILSTVSNLGLGISALIISQGIVFGYHDIFIVTASILAAVSFLLLIKQLWQRQSIVTRISAMQKAKITKAEPVRYSNKSVWVGLMSVLLIGSIVAQFGSTYAVHIRNTFPELAVSGVSILFAVNAFFVVIFSVPLGNALKEYNKVLMVGIGALLIGMGMAMLSISSLFIMAVLACLIYTIGEIIFFSMVQLVCYQSGKTSKKGRSLGIYRTTYALSRVVGPTAGGFIYLHFSGNVLWYLCGVTGCICFAACYLFKSSLA